MEISRFTQNFIDRNEKEIKECREFIADLQRKVDYMRNQNRELKGVDDVRGNNRKDSQRSSS